MFDYIRRKVTYSLASGGRGNGSSTARSNSDQNNVKYSANPFKLLNGPDDSLYVDAYVILDGYQRFPADKSYIEMGVREGWLVKTGFYPEDEKLVWTYVMKSQIE